MPNDTVGRSSPDVEDFIRSALSLEITQALMQETYHFDVSAGGMWRAVHGGVHEALVVHYDL